ncbi:MAG: tetratricopeptide repeat protein [Acidobacteriota bacterium]
MSFASLWQKRFRSLFVNNHFSNKKLLLISLLLPAILFTGFSLKNFHNAAAADLLNLEATLEDSKAARARFDFVEALQLLETASRFHKPAVELFNEYGNLYLDAEEPDRAEIFFNKALKINPSNEAALIGRAAVDLMRRDYNNAETYLLNLLSANKQSLTARTALAKVFLDSNQLDKAATEAERVLAVDANNKDALYILAFVKATGGEAKEARAMARRALELDPFNPNLRRLLSQYVDGRAGYTQRVSRAAQERFETGRALKQAGNFTEAEKVFEQALKLEPLYYRALIALGDMHLRRGAYEQAMKLAQKALTVDGEGASAHLIFCYAVIGMREASRIAIGASDFAKAFFKQPAPPKFALTAEIFPNYKNLNAREQIVIDGAVAPLAHFLPTLAAKKARHYLIAFDERASDIRGVEDVERERTFDGRFFASLRGVGGRVTVSGIEYIEMAARAGFHTIAHEFAHQVQMLAMERADLNRLRKLYQTAVREGRALDYYAESDELEYFAQGYEAFIAEIKRPATGMTARHTRQELIARDPDLYGFIEGLTRREQPARALN